MLYLVVLRRHAASPTLSNVTHSRPNGYGLQVQDNNGVQVYLLRK